MHRVTISLRTRFQCVVRYSHAVFTCNGLLRKSYFPYPRELLASQMDMFRDGFGLESETGNQYSRDREGHWSTTPSRVVSRVDFCVQSDQAGFLFPLFTLDSR